MRYRAEPPTPPAPPARCAVVLVNLGTPEAPTPRALRRYLAEFLGDPRVVEIPRLAWWFILHGLILRLRPRRSAAKYARIWLPEGSPLAVWTQRQADALAGALAEASCPVHVRHAMRYGQPALPKVLDALRAAGATRILLLPLYPQYAAATSGSVSDSLMAWSVRARRVPELRFVADYHEDPGYIAALAASVRDHWQRHGRAARLVLSFHGLPQRAVQLGDPYHAQCLRSAELLARHLGLASNEWVVTFQSRVGRARWLEPYTEPTLRTLAAAGVKSVDVMCPGFAADCLETLEEIDIEARAAFLAAGGERFAYVACLNTTPAWMGALAALAQRHMQGWDTQAGTTAGDSTPFQRDRPRM